MDSPNLSTVQSAAKNAPSSKTVQVPARSKYGLLWALLSPLFLGGIPILAKLAYQEGVSVMTVVAFRTIFAAAVLWAATFLFARHFIRSSAPAIIGSMIAGSINGIGSIFYYTSLTQIDASLGQLINITYLIFVTILLRLAGHSISGLTLFRTLLTIFAIFLLTQGSITSPNWIGVGMMLLAALSYAIQLVLSQRIMLDIPAPTMTLYAMTAMAAVVSVAWFFRPENVFQIATAGWYAILAMGLITALSRLTLFLGVKSLGSIQAALLGVLEVIVTIVIAGFLLDERLSGMQWIGAAVLVVSIMLVQFEKGVPKFIDWYSLLLRWYIRAQR